MQKLKEKLTSQSAINEEFQALLQQTDKKDLVAGIIAKHEKGGKIEEVEEEEEEDGEAIEAEAFEEGNEGEAEEAKE